MDIFNLETFALWKSNECNVCESNVEEEALGLLVVDPSSDLLIIDQTQETVPDVVYTNNQSEEASIVPSSISEDQQDFQKRNKKTIKDVPYECKICSKQFTQRSNLWKHVKLHTGETPYQCPICAKTFTQQANCQRHQQTHTIIQPTSYHCDICAKSFSQQVNLNKHMLMHSGSKPFICTTCQKTFNQKSNLTKHQLIHTKDRPFSCEICDATFNQKNHLKKHKLTHDTSRAYYSCENCGKVFVSEEGSRIHLKACKGLLPVLKIS